LDLWGRFRRSIEASDAELDASIENYDNVLVILLADVATSYVQYRTFEERLVYARKNLEIQTKSYELAEDKFKHGAVTERDLQMAKQNLEQTRSLIPPLEIGERQSRNLLCVLLGIPPSDLGGILAKATDIPKAPNEVTVGIPADLLRRRPDIRQAERLVAAQSARIGVATADFYPRLTLNGTIGLSAEQFGQLFHTPGSMTGSFGPEFRWDILNYGRILNNVLAQDAVFEGLAFAYQNTVLNAARETEDALVGFLRTQTQAESLAASVAAANRTAEIALDQYRQGAVDFFPVYYFESILTQQQDQLAVARGQIALDLIGVYRALGGGWQMRLTRDGDNDPAPEQLPPLAVPAVPMRGAALPPTSPLDSPIRNTRKMTEKSNPSLDSSVRAPEIRKMTEKSNLKALPKADPADTRTGAKSEPAPKVAIPTAPPEHAPEI
jgi:NodT family efflux transporter outer membrane factor (OMF) lipoprotein